MDGNDGTGEGDERLALAGTLGVEGAIRSCVRGSLGIWVFLQDGGIRLFNFKDGSTVSDARGSEILQTLSSKISRLPRRLVWTSSYAGEGNTLWLGLGSSATKSTVKSTVISLAMDQKGKIKRVNALSDVQKGSVSCIAGAPGLLIVGSEDNKISLRDKRGKPFAILSGAAGGIHCITFCAATLQVWCGTADGLLVWSCVDILPASITARIRKQQGVAKGKSGADKTPERGRHLRLVRGGHRRRRSSGMSSVSTFSYSSKNTSPQPTPSSKPSAGSCKLRTGSPLTQGTPEERSPTAAGEKLTSKNEGADEKLTSKNEGKKPSRADESAAPELDFQGDGVIPTQTLLRGLPVTTGDSPRSVDSVPSRFSGQAHTSQPPPDHPSHRVTSRPPSMRSAETITRKKQHQRARLQRKLRATRGGSRRKLTYPPLSVTSSPCYKKSPLRKKPKQIWRRRLLSRASSDCSLASPRVGVSPRTSPQIWRKTAPIRLSPKSPLRLRRLASPSAHGIKHWTSPPNHTPPKPPPGRKGRVSWKRYAAGTHGRIIELPVVKPDATYLSSVGGVLSLQRAPNGQSVVAGCADGNVYTVSCDSKTGVSGQISVFSAQRVGFLRLVRPHLWVGSSGAEVKVYKAMEDAKSGPDGAKGGVKPPLLPAAEWSQAGRFQTPNKSRVAGLILAGKRAWVATRKPGALFAFGGPQLVPSRLRRRGSQIGLGSTPGSARRRKGSIIAAGNGPASAAAKTPQSARKVGTGSASSSPVFKIASPRQLSQLAAAAAKSARDSPQNTARQAIAERKISALSQRASSAEDKLSRVEQEYKRKIQEMAQTLQAANAGNKLAQRKITELGVRLKKAEAEAKANSDTAAKNKTKLTISAAKVAKLQDEKKRVVDQLNTLQRASTKRSDQQARTERLERQRADQLMTDTKNDMKKELAREKRLHLARVDQLESELKESKAAVLRLRGQLKDKQGVSNARTDSQLSGLRKENERISRIAREKEAALSSDLAQAKERVLKIEGRVSSLEAELVGAAAKSKDKIEAQKRKYRIELDKTSQESKKEVSALSTKLREERKRFKAEIDSLHTEVMVLKRQQRSEKTDFAKQNLKLEGDRDRERRTLENAFAAERVKNAQAHKKELDSLLAAHSRALAEKDSALRERLDRVKAAEIKASDAQRALNKVREQLKEEKSRADGLMQELSGTRRGGDEQARTASEAMRAIRRDLEIARRDMKKERDANARQAEAMSRLQKDVQGDQVKMQEMNEAARLSAEKISFLKKTVQSKEKALSVLAGEHDKLREASAKLHSEMVDLQKAGLERERILNDKLRALETERDVAKRETDTKTRDGARKDEERNQVYEQQLDKFEAQIRSKNDIISKLRDTARERKAAAKRRATEDLDKIRSLEKSLEDNDRAVADFEGKIQKEKARCEDLVQKLRAFEKKSEAQAITTGEARAAQQSKDANESTAGADSQDAQALRKALEEAKSTRIELEKKAAGAERLAEGLKAKQTKTEELVKKYMEALAQVNPMKLQFQSKISELKIALAGARKAEVDARAEAARLQSQLQGQGSANAAGETPKGAGTTADGSISSAKAMQQMREERDGAVFKAEALAKDNADMKKFLKMLDDKRKVAEAESRSLKDRAAKLELELKREKEAAKPKPVEADKSNGSGAASSSAAPILAAKEQEIVGLRTKQAQMAAENAKLQQMTKQFMAISQHLQAENAKLKAGFAAAQG